MLELNTIHNGDSLQLMMLLDDESIDTIITSPPYWQKRDYRVEGQIGLEATPDEFIGKLFDVFHQSKRVLKESGSLWIVISDSYSGNKNGITDSKLAYMGEQIICKRTNNIPRKSLMMIPERLTIMMIDDGWILRNKIIWQKPNIMPSSVADRFTVDYETIFFFTKSSRYYFEQQKEPMMSRGSKGELGNQHSGRRKQNEVGRADYTGFNARYEPPKDGLRNKRSVWNIPSSPGYDDNHFATFPEDLVKIMIKAGSPKDGVVLDCFSGSGTTCAVAKRLQRQYIGFELNADYLSESNKRIRRMPIEYTIDDFIRG